MLKCTQCLLQRTLVRKTALRASSQCGSQKFTEKGSLNAILNAQKAEPHDSDDFKLVYKFPFIHYLALINRLKIYQTAITAMMIPGALIMNQIAYIDGETCTIVINLGISGCVSLYGIGLITGNFIGHIYYNDRTKLARIAYTDQWGKRRNLVLPVNDIIPLDDLPVSKWNRLWTSFRRYSTNETLKINTDHAIIVDKEGFKRVL